MATDPSPIADRRRCDGCGYTLTGLGDRGVCPECGTPYTEQRSYGLGGWRHLLLVVARLSWPVVGLAAAVAYLTTDASGFSEFHPPDWIGLLVGLGGLVFALTLPLNLQFGAHGFLKRCLPPRIRNRTSIVVLRWIGTGVCVLGGLALLAGYLLLLGLHGISQIDMS